MPLPSTHAELDALAEEYDHEWSADDLKVADKQQELIDAGYDDEADDEPEDTAPETEEDAEEEEAPEIGPAGEDYPSLILEGTWVVLGATDNVPEELQGHEACVVNAPMKMSDGTEAIPHRHQYQEEDTVFTVRTRDQYSATLECTRDDFSVVSNQGRTGLGSAG